MELTIIMTETEERYSNRQIERLLDEQSKDIKRHIDDKTAPILTQTMKTNGRVTKTEEAIVGQKVWRGWMVGGLTVLSILLPILVAVQGWELLAIIKQEEVVNNLPATVRQAVSDEITNRVETVEIQK